MPELVTATVLASSAVALVTPYLTEAAKAGAKTAGEAAATGVGRLWGMLRARLTSPAAAEAVQELEQHPEEADVQAAARRQLKKALEADAAWQAEIAELVKELGGASTGARQELQQVGNDNIGVQAVDSQVNIHGRGSGT